MIRIRHQQLLLRWCAACPANWKWSEELTRLLSLTQKLSLTRLQMWSNSVRQWMTKRPNNHIFRLMFDNVIDWLVQNNTSPLGKHLKGLVPGLVRGWGGKVGCGGSDQSASCIRTSGNLGDVQWLSMVTDVAKVAVMSSLIFQASCLAVWEGQVYSVQVHMNFVFLSEANLPDLSLVWATGGRFKGAGGSS